MKSNNMNKLITIYSICYNEQVMMQFFINHYRNLFPNCRIVIYDNYSTDRTEEIALANGCEVIKYDSNNEIRDDLYLEIKNNCWILTQNLFGEAKSDIEISKRVSKI